MARGGHANSGPVPDPMALRRERPSDQATWTRIPNVERTEPSPAWPLTRQTIRERALWEREWRRPQAVLWLANGWETEVALYVRSLRDAEQPKARTPVRTLVRQFMESLGISADGLRRNRWTLVDATAMQARATGTDGRQAAPRWTPEVIDGGS